MSGETAGHIYRIARADKQRLLKAIGDHVGGTGWTFGGAAQWDFDPYLDNKRKNLREIKKFPTQTSIDVSGDFGHAFNSRAEVRWKRRGDDVYDVLVLCETQCSVDGATELCVRHWDIQQQQWIDGEWTTHSPGVAAIHQTAGRPSLLYIDYCAPNGAVQFQRLAGEQS